MELRIDELLEERGISQTEMAHDLGVKQPTVSRWVKNESSPPTKRLQEIAAYFKVEPLELFRLYATDGKSLTIFHRLRLLDESQLSAIEQVVAAMEPQAQS